jgi:glyoxylate/hydroxypyruvate reductase
MNSSPRVVFCATHTQAEPWLEVLRAQLPGFTVDAWHADHAADPAAEHTADYAVVWAPPQAFIDQVATSERLKAVFNLGAGVDALVSLRWPSLKGAPPVPLIRLDDAGMGTQMAEYVCQAVTRHVRELDVVEAQSRQGQWAFRKPRLRADFPVGVLGLGVLGQRVALALRSFEYTVHGWSRSAKQIEGVTTYGGMDALEPMLSKCRILVNLLPLTDQTQDLLNKQRLSKLMPGGYVINVARGAHVVDEDLVALLDSGHLAGAMLDVFRQEPLPADHAFWKHPKIVVTPHTSSRTLRNESLAQIAQKILRLEHGADVRSLPGLVDRSRGY